MYVLIVNCCTHVILSFLHSGQNTVLFPKGLANYGLNESLLDQVWTQVRSHKKVSLKWSLKGVPNVDFYQDLHPFLKKWPKTCQTTKMTIGHFYIAIDVNLQVKGCRPDNAYRFIERTCQKSLPRSSRMKYGFEEQALISLRTEIENYTERTHQVFHSEQRLYGNCKDVNHRLHKKSQPVHRRLLTSDEWDENLLYPLVISGAAAMEEKLCDYTSSYLPSGIYWEPEPKVKEILSELKPSNDLCESLLGLNDYLSRALPNMHQMSQSNLIQVNKTVDWLQKQPSTEQERVIDLAVRRRMEVSKESKQEDEKNSVLRREEMKHTHLRRQALLQRAQREKEKLLQLHLITSRQELLAAIDEIDHVAGKSNAKKLLLLRGQVNIWKKVLKRNINIPFSHSRRQRPVDVIIQELGDYIESINLPPSVKSITSEPESLIGKHVKHKFELEETHESKWFFGHIVNYDSSTKLYEIAYVEEEEHCNFDIVLDLLLGDIDIIDI